MLPYSPNFRSIATSGKTRMHIMDGVSRAHHTGVIASCSELLCLHSLRPYLVGAVLPSSSSLVTWDFSTHSASRLRLQKPRTDHFPNSQIVSDTPFEKVDFRTMWISSKRLSMRSNAFVVIFRVQFALRRGRGIAHCEVQKSMRARAPSRAPQLSAT